MEGGGLAEVKEPGRPAGTASAARTEPGSPAGRPKDALPQAPPGGRPQETARTPLVVTVSGRRPGRLSVAGLIAMRPGSRIRPCHRLRTHRAGKNTRRSRGERDFIALIDGVHQLAKAPVVLVRGRLNTRVSRTMQDPVAEREWLRVFLLPAYSPDLDPAERGGRTSNAVWPTSSSSPWAGSKPSCATGSSACSAGPAPSTAS